jgi:HK97 family phage portal protein
LGIISTVRSLLARAAPLPAPRAGASFGRLIAGSDIDASPIKNKRGAADAYAGWVFAAASFIAEEMRALEWVNWRRTSIRRDEWERDDRHPFNRVLEHPNPREAWGDFIERTDLSFSIAGEVYWHVIRDGRAAVGLEVILPHWVTEPVMDRSGRHAAWRVTVPGFTPVELPVEDVIRVHRPHPLSPWMAASVVEAAAVSHFFDLYLRAYGMTVFRNDGGVPAGLLSTDQDLTEAQSTDLQERWRQRYSRTRGEVAVLGRNAKYQTIAIPMADMSFLEVGKFTRDQVLSMFRVPSSLLGADESGVNRASIDGHLYAFQRHALRPRAQRYASIIRERVAPIFMDNPRGYWFEFEGVVSRDRSAIREEATEALRWGAITRNEYRQKLDLDPVPGGDVYHLPNSHTVTPAEPEPEEEERALPAPDPELGLLLAAARRRADAAEAQAEAAQAQADTLRREAAERRAYTALRGLFASWWRDRDGETVSMRGLDEHALTVHDLPDVQDGEAIRDWIERLKGAEGKRLARLSVERSPP